MKAVEVSTQRKFSEFINKSNLTVVDFFATCRYKLILKRKREYCVQNRTIVNVLIFRKFLMIITE